MSAQILHGDCIAIMRDMPEASVDAIVTDPPYHLTNQSGGPRGKGLDSPHARSRAGASSAGFMGMAWDGGDVAMRPETWAAALRVLKPGGYLLAFSGTRTYHRMACAIEDAGFEIRDQIGWAFGSGFPKSHNGEWGGTALKPAWEPICMARKPLIGTVEANWRAHGTGALNIDGCRVDVPPGDVLVEFDRAVGNVSREHWRKGTCVGAGRPVDRGRWPANIIHDGSDEVLQAFPDAPGQMADASSSSRKTQNVYGAMRRGNGREGEASANCDNGGVVGFSMRPGARRLDAGSAARFFYCAKASREDRNEGCDEFERKPLNWSSGTKNPGSFQADGTDRTSPNHHPTVKPTDLMRYLCRLVTPAGGTVLDPFAGSGSTGKASVLEGFNFVGIELEAEYVAIARARVAFATRQGHQRGLALEVA